jgi:hypothetical protein
MPAPNSNLSLNLPHFQLEKARHYKAEFLMTMYGATSATSEVEIKENANIFKIASNRDNVIGLGFGLRMTNGVLLNEEVAIRVYVREKSPLASLGGRAIPSQVNGVSTDIIPIADLVAATRPTPCGVSIGHHAITAGTLGCLVKKPEEDDLYILSNNHVLADCDKASIGDPILEPGPDDGGRLDDPIAHLTDFEPISHGNPNIFDAAIAKLLDRTSVTSDIQGIGNVQQPPMQPVLNQRVLKHGRTTGLTQGVIAGIAEDVPIRYGSQYLNFEEQLAIETPGGIFGRRGDSGALVVDSDTSCPVGLFVAVDLAKNGTVFANPIMPILSRFGVEVV